MRTSYRLLIVLLLVISPCSALAQLVVGNNAGVNGKLWVIDLVNPSNNRSLLAANQTYKIHAIAADNDMNVLYFLDNFSLISPSRLLTTPMISSGTITPSLIGNVKINGINIEMVSLAYDTLDNVLVGYKSATTAEGVKGFYSINTSTAECALLASVPTTANYDFPGMDYDRDTDAFYVTNDFSSTQGIYRINKPWTTPLNITFLSPYPPTSPTTEDDIDGLAAGQGRLYLVNDNNSPPVGGGHYVYNLSTNSYEPHIPFTWSSGTVCGGAWAPGMVIPPPPGANLAADIAGPTDCAATIGDTVIYSFIARNFGPDPAVNVELHGVFPSNLTFVTSAPPVVPVGNTLAINLGTIPSGGIGAIDVEFTINSGPTIDMTNSVNSATTDLYLYNNSTRVKLNVLTALPVNLPIKGILSSIASSDTSLVPGLQGIRFSGDPTSSTIFFRPFVSRNGQYWIMIANTNAQPSSQNQVLLVGDVATGLSSVVAREGVTMLPEGYIAAEIAKAVGVNDAGQFCFSTNSLPTSTQVLVKWNGAEFVTVAKEGNPTMLGSGINYVGSESTSIANDGLVSFTATILGPDTTTSDNAVNLTDDGATLLAREGVTVPTNQPGGVQNPYETFESGVFTDYLGPMWSSDGTSFSSIMGIRNAIGTLVRILVVNNDVKLQQGVEVPGGNFGSPIASESPRSNIMASNGDWYSSGSNVDGGDWVVRNGAVIAISGNPVVPGNPLYWDGTVFTPSFFSIAGGPGGSYVIGGNIGGVGVTPFSDTVLVLNGTTILAREGDPIDLNNDGAFNVADDFYIHSFLPFRMFLTDQYVYAVVRLRSPQDARCASTWLDIPRGQALVRIPIGTSPPIHAGDVNCDGVVDGRDVPAFVLAVLDPPGHQAAYAGCNILNADTNSSGTQTEADIPSLITLMVGP